jgi:hypothetical protein
METRTNDQSRTNDHILINLIRELRDETSTLVRQEIALAKAETTEKAARLGRNAAYMVAGVAVAYAAFFLVLLGFRDLAGAGIIKSGAGPETAAWLSSFIVALVVGLVGWLLIAKGKKALSTEGLTPKKTFESLREDEQFIKHKLART